jgi:phospholipid-translocating ATPase
MSAPHQQDRRFPSSPRSEDSTSEDDLDLQELDPGMASTYLSRHDRSDNEAGIVLGETRDAIPLRNVHTSRLGAQRQRPHRYGNIGRRRGEQADDIHGLLGYHDEADKRDATDVRKMINGDGHSPTAGHGRKKRNDGHGSRFGSTLRFPSFRSAASGGTAPEHLEQDSEQEHDPSAARHILVGQLQPSRFPPNSVSNAKYTPWSFLPRTLYKEFSFFFNMYFLLVGLSQIIPALRIGYLSTYVAPLVFVLAITLGKEAADDVARRRRDAESNMEAYTVLQFHGSQHDYRSKGGLRRGMLQPITARRKATINEGEDRLPAIQEEEEHLIGKDEPKALSAGVLEVSKRSRDLKVGDVLKLGRNQRVPADVVVLKTYTAEGASNTALKDTALGEEPAIQRDPFLDGSAEEAPKTQDDSSLAIPNGHNASTSDATAVGEAFIRTDQLDGETDWKLRVASPLSQALDISAFTRLKIVASKPDRKVNEFVGTLELLPVVGMTKKQEIVRGQGTSERGVETFGDGDPTSAAVESAPLTIDNTAWANTVVASACTTLAVVVYTGPQTRQALSTSPSRSKTGLLDCEINHLTKILCAVTLALSLILVALEGLEKRESQKWYVAMMRFLILFSTIIPISLRVNLDMGKTVYARFIERDPDVPGAVVRTSTIPEELGRVEYLLSDKTGTLTQNGMERPTFS